jgi:hypothetical protein
MANEYEHTTNLGVRSSNLFGRASDLRDLGWKDRWLASQKLKLGSKSGPTIDRSGAGGLIVARRGVCRRRVVTPPGSTDTYMVVLLWLFCVKNET